MGSLGGHNGQLCEVLEVYGDPMGLKLIGGHLYEVWKVYGDPRGS